MTWFRDNYHPGGTGLHNHDPTFSPLMSASLGLCLVFLALQEHTNRHILKNGPRLRGFHSECNLLPQPTSFPTASSANATDIMFLYGAQGGGWKNILISGYHVIFVGNLALVTNSRLLVLNYHYIVRIPEITYVKAHNFSTCGQQYAGRRMLTKGIIHQDTVLLKRLCHNEQRGER